MAKVFMGVRLQRLREERALTQVALARTLGISASYLNQIERNQRPLTMAIMLRIGATLGVDPQLFSEHDSAGLVADVRDVFGELDGAGPTSLAELRMLVENMPDVARAIVQLQQRYRLMAGRADALAAQLDDGGRGHGWIAPSSDEEVRDYLNRRQNYIDELDQAAEAVFDACGAAPGHAGAALQRRLEQRHGVLVQDEPQQEQGQDQRQDRQRDGGAARQRYDARRKILWLPDTLGPGQRAFQMAARIGLLEHGERIAALRDGGGFSGEQARLDARLALSNYFAGALLMPYRRFLQEAEAGAYDVERLAHRFGVGFEAVCHRLSTMQRPGQAGLPFFFMRVDRAGNVSKRQSATDFHFSRVGGTCPLWIVYEAFSHPSQVLTQVARMPDGRTYLWIARQVGSAPAAFRSPGKTFAVALGCDITQAHRLVYSTGLDLKDPSAATPIGSGCKVCERVDCPQRAFRSILPAAAMRPAGAPPAGAPPAGPPPSCNQS